MVQWAVTPHNAVPSTVPLFQHNLFYDDFRKYSPGFLPVGLLGLPRRAELRPVGILVLAFFTLQCMQTIGINCRESVHRIVVCMPAVPEEREAGGRNRTGGVALTRGVLCQAELHQQTICEGIVVGGVYSAGFEPAASPLPRTRSTRLNYEHMPCERAYPDLNRGLWFRRPEG